MRRRLRHAGVVLSAAALAVRHALSCAVRHGATGRGLGEAVLAVPPDYRDCARCHHPQYAPQTPGSEIMGSVTASSSGDPPPLADLERLARFGTVGAPLAFVRASRPRWDPGASDVDACLTVTEHVLRLAGSLADGERSPADGLDRRPIR